MNPIEQKAGRFVIEFLRKSLAAVLICTLVFAMFVVPGDMESVYAADEKAHLNVYYMGKGRTPDFLNAKKGADVPRVTGNDVVWVGVAVNHLDRLGQGDVPGGFINERGVISMEIGFDYNSKYIAPAAFESGGTVIPVRPGYPQDVADWQAVLREQNIGAIGGGDADKKWNEEHFALADATSEGTYDDEDLMFAEFDPPVKGDGAWKMLQLTINLKDASSDAQRLKQAAGEQYLLLIPFFVTALPNADAPASEKEAPIRLARSPERFGFVSTPGGDPSAPDHAYWEKDEQSNAAINLKNMFEFSGDLDIFGGGVPSPSGQAEIGSIDVKRYYDETAGDPPVVTEKDEPLAAHMDKNAPADPTGYDTYDNASPAVPVKEDGGVSTHILDEAYAVPTKPYSSKITNYYSDVKHDTKKLEFTFDGVDSLPAVQINGVPHAGVLTDEDSTAFAGKKKYTLTIDQDGINALTPVDPANLGDEGFKNTVAVTVGSGTDARTYTLHLRKLLKPQIVLNYGNSPYGEIMRMGALPDSDPNKWDAAKVERAKQYFDANYKFGQDMTPDGRSSLVKYTPNAWGNPISMVELKPDVDLDKWKADIANVGLVPFINYDMDPYAQFICMREKVVDSGFVLQDSLGQHIPVSIANKVSLKIVYDKMVKPNVEGFEDGVTTEVLERSLTGISGENILSEFSAVRVKPGRYTMKYVFVDTFGTKVENTRNVIILPRLGDVNMDTILNSADATTVRKALKKKLPSEETVGSEAQGRLYRYRVADVNKDTVVNSADATAIGKNLKFPIVQFYF